MLRILAILLITTVHYINYSKIMDNNVLTTANRIFLAFFDSLRVAGVNIFVLITGFFQCTKKPNLTKIFDLWMRVVTISVLLLVFSALFLKNITISAILKSFLPITTVHYWFFVTYVLLYFISPYLNMVIERVEQKKLFWLCVSGGFVISVLFVMNPFAIAEVYIGHSHGICWFVYLYFVGAYIRLYGCRVRNRYVFAVSLSVFTLIYIIKYFKIASLANLLMFGNDSLLPLILSVSLFILFKDVNINSTLLSSASAKLVSCSFFVYIIQEHDLIRNWFWNLFSITKYADSYFLPINFAISLLVLWPIAYLYVYIYDRLFGKLSMKIYDRFADISKRLLINRK